MTYSEQLVCSPLTLSYDFRTRTGTLMLEDGHCCDMRGCIDMFKAIDPAVKRIDTYSGSEPDTSYHLGASGWHTSTDGVHYA